MLPQEEPRQLAIRPAWGHSINWLSRVSIMPFSFPYWHPIASVLLYRSACALSCMYLWTNACLPVTAYSVAATFCHVCLSEAKPGHERREMVQRLTIQRTERRRCQFSWNEAEERNSTSKFHVGWAEDHDGGQNSISLTHWRQLWRHVWCCMRNSNLAWLGLRLWIKFPSSVSHQWRFDTINLHWDCGGYTFLFKHYFFK